MVKLAAISRFLDYLARFERLACFVAFALLASVVFFDVLMRELLGNGIPWARQVGVYANIFVAMLGMGVASQSGSHLRPRFADHWLPERWSFWIDHVQEGITALFCVGIALLSIQLVLETYQMQEQSTVLRIAIWPMQALIPLAFALSGLRHALYALAPSLRPNTAILE